MANARSGVGTPSRPGSPGDKSGLLRWVCTSNPFYALSAVLFLAGLRLSVESQPEAIQALTLMIGLAAYTLLLAATAWGLVRFAAVWDDVRTLLLLVVLMFLATSVTFDEVLVLNPTRGLFYFLAGFAFALVVSELLLRGLGMRLPVWFRLPYYLILGLFFLYPVLLQPLVADPTGEPLQWGLFGFATLAGLCFLTLLPAVRMGAAGLRDNGTPWAWPYYPWALFVILAVAVPGRAVLLCWSMQLLDVSRSGLIVFGPYFLVPFGLALAILILEAGLVARRTTFLVVALIAPLGLVSLALLGHRGDSIYQTFLGHFHTRLGGDPLFITLLLGMAFYAYAALRRAPGAIDALTVALLAVACTPPDVLTTGGLRIPPPEPLLAAGLLQLALGLRRHGLTRSLVGTTVLLVGTTLALPSEMRTTPLAGALLLHLVVAALLFLGAIFHGWMGRLLQLAGAGLLVLTSLALLVPGVMSRIETPAWVPAVYPLAAAALLLTYGVLLRRRSIQILAGVIVVGWLAIAGGVGYVSLRQSLPGLDFLTLSLLLFAVAVLVSLVKGGVLMGRRSDGDEVPLSVE